MHKNSQNIYSVLIHVIILSKVLFLSSLYTKQKVIIMINMAVSFAICYDVLTMLKDVFFMLQEMNTNVCNSTQLVWCIFLTIELLACYITTHLLINNKTGDILKLNIIVKYVKYSHLWKAKILCAICVLLNTTSVVSTNVIEYFISNSSLAVYKLVYAIYLEIAAKFPGIQFAAILICLKYLFRSMKERIKDIQSVDHYKKKQSREYDDKNRNTRLAELKMALALHSELCDVAESVSYAHSFALLVSLARIFTICTHVVYYFCTMTIFTHVVCDRASSVAYSMWILQQCVLVCMFVYTATSTAKEVGHTFAIMRCTTSEQCVKYSPTPS